MLFTSWVNITIQREKKQSSSRILYKKDIYNAEKVTQAISTGISSTLSGDVAIGGDLSVTALTSVNDEISAKKPVVELMNGYSLTLDPSNEALDMEFIYGGIVKNGNKLTFALALNITRLDDVTSYGEYQRLGTFYVPDSVGARIYPAITSTPYGSIVGGGKVSCINTAAADVEFTIVDGFLQYGGSTSVSVMLKQLNNLTLNVKYYARYEITVLLSENLVA